MLQIDSKLYAVLIQITFMIHSFYVVYLYKSVCPLIIESYFVRPPNSQVEEQTQVDKHIQVDEHT